MRARPLPILLLAAVAPVGVAPGIGAGIGGPLGAVAGNYIGGKIGGLLGREAATAVTPGP